MEQLKETKSNWDCVTEMMDEAKPIRLGRYASYWFHKTPRRMLHSLSYYKFAAKMIGKEKRILDVGCNEGLGSWVLAKECGYCKGIDFDEEAIEVARQNFEDPSIDFTSQNILDMPPGSFDAVTSFDVIEHILPENASLFLERITENLTSHGIAVIGTPSLISQEFASEISKKGHVNIYSHERLKKEMERFFEFVFFFAANDEVIHAGYLPLAHYFIVIGCRKRDR